jgi:hypothetical protein
MTMTTAKIVTSLLTALLAYASFELSNTPSENSVADAQQQDCMTVECATTIDLPPSSNLFL